MKKAQKYSIGFLLSVVAFQALSEIVSKRTGQKK